MNRQHFEAFAEIAKNLRCDAKVQESRGNIAFANSAYQQAIGIEYAVIKVAQRFNPRFDEARFRQACNPDV